MTRLQVFLILFAAYGLSLCHSSINLPLAKKPDKLSYEPIFKVDEPEYDFVTNNNFDLNSKKKGSSWRSILKKLRVLSDTNKKEDVDDNDGIADEAQEVDHKSLVPKSNGDDKTESKTSKWFQLLSKMRQLSRKGSYNKMKETNEKDGDDNINDSSELGFIHEPFEISLENSDDDDEGKLQRKKLWDQLLKKLWSPSFNSLKSLSPTSFILKANPQTDRKIDKLLDDFVEKNNYRTSSKEDTINTEEEGQEIPVPTKPKVNMKDFGLCEEVKSGQVHVLDMFNDGKAPSCSFACLFYKIKFKFYFIRPIGRCARTVMSGQSYGSTETDISCICNTGFNKYTIIQKQDVLYHVFNKEMALWNPLGTIDEITKYVEDNFLNYLKDFLKSKRGIDWKGMFEYVRDFRYLRDPGDDRSVETYLSDTLEDEIIRIKIFWYSLPQIMLRFGNNRFNPY